MLILVLSYVLFSQVASKLMFHKHAHTWSVLKTLYGSSAGSGTSAALLQPGTKSTQATGSGGGPGSTANDTTAETPSGNISHDIQHGQQWLCAHLYVHRGYLLFIYSIAVG